MAKIIGVLQYGALALFGLLGAEGRLVPVRSSLETAAALYVVDRGGRIHLTKTGAATPGDLEEVFRTVERLMK